MPRDRQKSKESSRRWRQRNPEHVRAYSRAWHLKNPGQQRKYDLLFRYGLTEEIYQKMAEAQNHACKICQRPAQLEHHGRLHVDHIKGTRVVRGLLCSGCNKGLGLFQDSPAVLGAAIEYLRCQPLTP